MVNLSGEFTNHVSDVPSAMRPRAYRDKLSIPALPETFDYESGDSDISSCQEENMPSILKDPDFTPRTSYHQDNNDLVRDQEFPKGKTAAVKPTRRRCFSICFSYMP